MKPLTTKGLLVKKTLFLVAIFFLNYIPLLGADKSAVLVNSIELIKRDLLSRDKSIVVLEPFEVKDNSLSVGYTQYSKSLEVIEIASPENNLFGKKLPFSFVELINEPISISEFSLSVDGLKKARGGIILSSNATLYIKVGLLWKTNSKYKFYFPLRYKSVVGIGFRRDF